MATHTMAKSTADILPGAVTGMLAGVLMAMYAMVHGAMVGIGFWTPVTLIAASLMGLNALVSGVSATALGIVMHMAVSAGFGILFVFLLPRNTGAGAALAAGVGFAVGVWALMTFVALPLVNPVMSARVALMPMSWFINHLFFGAGLGLAPFFLRMSSPRRLPA